VQVEVLFASNEIEIDAAFDGLGKLPYNRRSIHRGPLRPNSDHQPPDRDPSAVGPRYSRSTCLDELKPAPNDYLQRRPRVEGREQLEGR